MFILLCHRIVSLYDHSFDSCVWDVFIFGLFRPFFKYAFHRKIWWRAERWIEMFVCVLAQGNNINQVWNAVVVVVAVWLYPPVLLYCYFAHEATFNLQLYTLPHAIVHDNCHLFQFNFLRWVFIAAVVVADVWRIEEFNRIYANHCQSSNYYYETLDSYGSNGSFLFIFFCCCCEFGRHRIIPH